MGRINRGTTQFPVVHKPQAASDKCCSSPDLWRLAYNKQALFTRNVRDTSRTTKLYSSSSAPQRFPHFADISCKLFPQAAPAGIWGRYLNLRKLAADDFLSLEENNTLLTPSQPFSYSIHVSILTFILVSV
ncbi:MAG: hypothetical protein NC314_03140 [Roseburia sp.]|nr:hypothetical protein [Roseburia sp.]